MGNTSVGEHSIIFVGTLSISGAHTYLDNRHMNFGLGSAPALLLLLPVVVWLVVLYLLVRFLHAFERGVSAHERIADALTKQLAAPRLRPDERAP